MENLTITINGDVLFDFGSPADSFDDRYDDYDDYDDDACETDVIGSEGCSEDTEDEDTDEEADTLPEYPGLRFLVSGLPEDIDRKAVESVMSEAFDLLKDIISKQENKASAGGGHERI